MPKNWFTLLWHGEVFATRGLNVGYREFSLAQPSRDNLWLHEGQSASHGEGRTLCFLLPCPTGHTSRMVGSALSSIEFLPKIQCNGKQISYGVCFPILCRLPCFYKQELAGHLLNIMALKLSSCFLLLLDSCSEDVPWWLNHGWSDTREALGTLVRFKLYSSVLLKSQRVSSLELFYHSVENTWI